MTTSAATTKLMHIMSQKELPADPKEKLAYIEDEMIGKSYAGEVTTKRKEADF